MRRGHSMMGRGYSATGGGHSAMSREGSAMDPGYTATGGSYLAMSRAAMPRAYPTAVVVALLALPALFFPTLPVLAAQVDASELARCHAIAAKDERLSCYEALTEAALSATAAARATVAPGAPTATTTAGGATAASTSGSTATAAGPTAAGTPTPGTSAALAGQPSAAAGSAALPPRPVDPNDPANFGLSRQQLESHASSSGPTSIKSGVSQITEDRNHNITVVLDNGQTWVFIEPEPRLRPGDTVTIKRASLGSFLMLTPSRRSYRVERAK
jgi:hypothetical protein